MDRTSGKDNVDIGGGRRGFQDQNAVAGIAGTRVDAAFLNSIQEEILSVIEGAGLTPDAGNWQQLLNAIKKISNDGISHKFPLSQLNGLPWLPVISMSQTTPPSNPKPGDFYLVPLAAKAAWSGKSGHIAEWNGDNWLFSLAADGHGIGLPDGQIWQKINGNYVSLDSRYSRLTAPPTDTYYVIGDKGDDTNSGIAPTPNDGFATIQGAIDAIKSRYMSMNLITINVAPGTYDGFRVDASMINKWALIGDPNQPDNVIINATRTTSAVLRSCIVFSNAVHLSGFSFKSYYENVSAAGGTISVKDCKIALPGAGCAALASYGGKLSLYGNINITGSGTTCIFAGEGGLTRLGYKDIGKFTPVFINYDNVNTSTNLDAQSSGTMILQPEATNFSGSCNGTRFYAAANGVILLNGLGQYAIPGTRNGITTSGGQLY